MKLRIYIVALITLIILVACNNKEEAEVSVLKNNETEDVKESSEKEIKKVEEVAKEKGEKIEKETGTVKEGEETGENYADAETLEAEYNAAGGEQLPDNIDSDEDGDKKVVVGDLTFQIGKFTTNPKTSNWGTIEIDITAENTSDKPIVINSYNFILSAGLDTFGTDPNGLYAANSNENGDMLFFNDTLQPHTKIKGILVYNTGYALDKDDDLQLHIAFSSEKAEAFIRIQ